MQLGKDCSDGVPGSALGSVENVDVATGVHSAQRPEDHVGVRTGGPARHQRQAAVGGYGLGDHREFVDAMDDVEPAVGDAGDGLDGGHQREAVVNGDPRALFLTPAFTRLPDLAHSSATTWTQLVYLALFCSVFALLAQTWAVQRTSASRASLLLGTEPIWAVAFGISLGGERLTLWATLGAMLMIAGTYWGQAIERTHRTTTARTMKKDGERPAMTPAGA